MKSIWLRVSRLVSSLFFLVFLASCNNLSVFVPPNTPSSFDKISDVSVDSQGLLQLSWLSKTTSHGSFDIYEMKVDNSDTEFQFTGAALTKAPLTSETLILTSSKDSPKVKGKLLATVKDLNFTYSDLLQPDQNYLIQIVEKGRALNQNQQPVLLVRVAFKGITAATAQLSDSSVTINWNSVSGANLYKIYADEAMSILLGESSTTSLTLSLKAGEIPTEFYIKAFRGALAAPDITKVKIEKSKVHVVEVKSLSANGYYKAGDVLNFSVVFSDVVTAFGDLGLPLKIGADTRSASYVSGVGSNTILYRYSIQASDNTQLLENGSVLLGSYVDKFNLEISAATPALGKSLNIQETSTIVVDNINPTNPSLVTFDAFTSSNGNLSVHWTSGSDANFAKDEIKLCANSACDNTCSIASAELSGTKAYTGLADGLYYACVRSVDNAGHATDWAVSLPPATVDSVAPFVFRVYSPSATSIYKEGQTVPVNIEFSEAVNVTAGGDLGLLLETGTTDRTATYVSGSGSRFLTFNYVVQAGDNSAVLNYVDTHSLTFGASGSIRDASGLLADVTLPTLNSAISLAGQSNVVIDTLNPTNPTAVAFTTSSPAPTLNVSFNWTDSVDANLKQHNVKLCSAIDCSTSCLTAASTTSSGPVTLSGSNGSSYYACVQGEDKMGHLSAWVGSAAAITINATIPSIVELRATSADAIYKEGDVLNFSLLFSDVVRVTGGGIKILLATGSTNHEMSYVSGDNSNTLVFSYTVQSGDSSSDLNYVDASSLTLGGGTIKSTSGNNADLTLPIPSGANSLGTLSQIVLDTTAPTDPAAVSITNSNPSGSTSLALTWSSSSDSNFRYHNVKICSDTACSSSCLGATTAVGTTATITGVNGSSYYACVQGEDQSAHKSAWIASSSAVLIDTTAPTVTNVTSTSANAYYTTAASLSFTVKFSEVVTVSSGGSLALELETGTVDHSATYVSGSGSDTLVFAYTVQAGDTSPDLEYTSTSALRLTAGTLKDDAGNNAVLTLPALASAASIGGQKAIILDTTVPSAPSSVGFPAALSNVSTVSMSWSDSTDTNFQTHNIKLCSANDCATNCVSVGTDLSSPADIVGFNGNTYYGCVQGRDLAGLTSAWVPSLGTVTIDSNQPIVNSVTSTHADGAYKAGTNISIQINFNKAVYVTGSGSFGLLMETGTVDRTATFVSGSGTSTLNFQYVVQTGDSTSDLEYQSISALTIGAGTIKDAANNDAVLQLPALNSANSLAGQKAIVIDAIAPLAPVISSPSNNSYLPAAITAVSGTAEANSSLVLKDASTTIGTVTVSGAGTWSITLGTSLTDGSHSLTAVATDAVGNDSPASSTVISVVDTVSPTDPSSVGFAAATSNTASFSMSWSNSSDTNFSTHNVKICSASDCSTSCISPSTSVASPATVTGVNGGVYYGCVQGLDLAGNISAWKSSVSSILVDTVAPTVLNVTSTQTNGSYKAGVIIPISIKFSENVYVTSGGSLGLLLETGTNDQTAVYSSGSGSDTLVFSYTVQAGDTSADLDYQSLSALTTGAGTIRDVASNNATLTLPTLGGANSLAGQKDLVIDTTAPSAPVFTSPTNNSTVTSPITSVSGTSEANATVEVYENSVSLGTTTANGSGAWTLVLGSTYYNGTFTFTAVARDAALNQSATGSSQVTVAIPAPTVNAGSDILTTSSVTLVGTATNAVSYQWTKVSGPGTVTFGQPTSLTSTVSVGTDGVYVLRLTATNVASVSAADEMILTRDTTVPVFDGVTSVWNKGATSSTVYWNAATDNLSGAADIVYEICVTATTGSCTSSFVATVTVPPLTYDYNVTGLTAGTTYEYVVRAKDLAGNTNNGSSTKSNAILANLKQVASGETHVCALLDDTNKTVKCWGLGTSGQLGNGSNSSSTSPVIVSSLTQVESLSNGGNHTCALLSNGTVKCWGKNNKGQLGNNSTTNSNVPVTATGVSGAVAISTGLEFSCAIINDGSMKCWGSNNHGQLGDATTVDKLTAVAVSGTGAAPNDVASIDLGNEHVCAKFNSGDFKCWGYNANGAVGDGTTVDKTTPTNIASLSGLVSKFSAGGLSTCAVLTTGAVRCWGRNFFGQLGDGSTSDRSSPTASVITSGAVSVSLGYEFTCVLMTAGDLRCFGTNSKGQFGVGNAISSVSPITPFAVTGALDYTAGNAHSCILQSDKTAKCWGSNGSGQVGNANANGPSGRYTPSRASVSGTVVAVGEGSDYACAMISNGTVQCWGRNDNGQIGNASYNNYVINASVPVTGISTATALGVGRFYACAVLNDGSVKCWGKNDQGQLGDGTTTNRTSPVTVAGISGATAVAGNLNHSCALLSDATMRCWGLGTDGQLGNGGTTSSLTPIDPGLSNIKKIGVGDNFTCAWIDDASQTLKCWGNNTNGQLGDGSNTSRSSPVTTTTGISEFAAGYRQACAVYSGGAVKCWGYNNHGQIGNSSTTSVNVPTQALASGAVSVAAAIDHSCAVLSTGTAKCWGSNANGILGNATNNGSDYTSALDVTGLAEISSLSAGGYSSCAILTGNRLRCWGTNSSFQLALDSAVQAGYLPTVPVAKGQ